MFLSKFKALTFFILCVFIFASCSGGGGSGDGSSTDTGTVSMSLMDLPNGHYKAVYVNISEVQVHKAGTTDHYADTTDNDGDGSWVTVGAPNKIYNLLELVNGVMESLGTRDLETGKYTQVRLIIGEEIPEDQDGNPDNNINGRPHPHPNYVIDQSDNERPLKIPSGFNTGIKLVHNFEVTKNGLMELILDFDAMRSIVESGNGKLTLKPTIKIIEAVNYAEVSGKVIDTEADSGEAGLGDVRVSSQTYDIDSGIITEHSATYTDAKFSPGYYRLIIEPNKSYNIVAFSTYYIPQCTFIVAENGMDYTHDFSLTPSAKREISLDIEFENGLPVDPPDVTVKLIYLNADCGDEALTDEIQVVESILTFDVTEYNNTDISLPYGKYKLIASAEGYTDFELDSFIVDNGNPADSIEIALQE